MPKIILIIRSSICPTEFIDAEICCGGAGHARAPFSAQNDALSTSIGTSYRPPATSASDHLRTRRENQNWSVARSPPTINRRQSWGVTSGVFEILMKIGSCYLPPIFRDTAWRLLLTHFVSMPSSRRWKSLPCRRLTFSPISMRLFTRSWNRGNSRPCSVPLSSRRTTDSFTRVRPPRNPYSATSQHRTRLCWTAAASC